ncbi:MAG: aldo/keto reductase [Desulfobacterales bacterium]|nr:aldo/keto reductase [Desulfobacterales bacterium]
MVTSINDCAELGNGTKMPWLGCGTFQIPDSRIVVDSVKWAIKAGYRHIDTASIYDNEAGVGKGISESGIPRDQLFITTKVWNADHGYNSTLLAFEVSLKKLGLGFIDLYLIHWPVKGKFKETWKAFEKLYKDKRVRAIGVSNFHVHHLKDLMSDCEIMPMVDQVEFHPLLTQKELYSFCKANSIQFEAWAPLMKGNLNSPLLAELSRKYGKTPAQVILRWDIQHGVITIPKSTHENRIIENTGIFDFILSAEDMAKIDGMNSGHRFGPDPDNFNF